MNARLFVMTGLLATLCMQVAAQTSPASQATQFGVSASASSNSASVMWATGGGTASLNSAQIHQAAGNSAASVEMARKGILYLNGASIAVQAIGSQAVVSTTIIGDGNRVDVDATQDARNTGDVSVRDVSIRDIGL